MVWTEGEPLTPTNLNNENVPVYNVKSYGAVGDGVTSDDAAFSAAEAARASAGFGILFIPPGKYALSNTTAASLMTIRVPGVWMGAGLSSTTLVYTGAASIDTGSDFSVTGTISTSVPAGKGILNVLANGVTLRDFAIDCSAKAQYAVAWWQGVETGRIDISIYSTKDKSFGGTYATWSGLNYCASHDISGVTANSANSLARGIGGFLTRKDCPIQNGLDTIIAHAPVTALILSGADVADVGAGGNSIVFTTGGAIAFPGTNSNQVPYTMIHARLDSVGLINGPVASPVFDNDYYSQDVYIHDIGNVVQETYGVGQTTGYGFGASPPGSGQSSNLGHIIKQGAATGWYHYNVIGSDVTAPNAWINGGSSQSQGFAHFERAHLSLRTTASSGNSSTLSSPELAVVALSATSCQLAVRSGNTTYLFNAIGTAL